MASTLYRTDRSRQAVLERMNRLAWLLDNSIRLPIVNYRIGLDALIGLIPGVGDAAGLLLSSFILMQAVRLGASKSILVRIVLNIVIEALIGMIPILGDLFDATFKANMRNVRLLAEMVDGKQPDRTPGAAPGTGMIILIIGLLAGVIVLFVGAGVALFWWVVSLFR